MQKYFDTERDLLIIGVEYSLLQMGTAELDLVEFRLRRNYNCTIGDCLEHPEYLKEVLRELYGYCYEDIIDNVKQVVRDGKMHFRIEKFLTTLNTRQLEA